MNHLQFLRITPQIPVESSLKGANGGGDNCLHLSGMDAHLITHSSRPKNDRNQWIVWLNRAKNGVYESSIIFKNRHQGKALSKIIMAVVTIAVDCEG